MPAEFEIKLVEPGDMQAIADLMQGLGYDHSVQEIARRWDMVIDRKSNPAFLARQASLPVGLIALHIAPLLFCPQPLARITTLVVDAARRRRGIGRALIEKAVQVSKDAGCDTLELTTGLQRQDARAFYRALGFDCSSLRMEQSLVVDV